MLVGCAEHRLDADTFQGVVEYDERNLGFEVSGRLAEIAVRAGDVVAPGALIARLDDSLARSALLARQSEAQAAQDQLSLLRAGARGEDVRAMRAARLEAAQANEACLSATSRARASSPRRRRHPAPRSTRPQAQLARAQAERRAVERTSPRCRARRPQAGDHGGRAPPGRGPGRRRPGEGAPDRATSCARRQAGEVLEVHLRPARWRRPGRRW